MRQEWYCEVCNKVGSVRMRKHLDAMSGMHMVVEDHVRVSPKCADSTKVRVRAPRCSQREWDKVSRKRENRLRDIAEDRLLRAVGAYIGASGGTAIIVGGIGIIPPASWEPKYNYSLLVRVTGHPPKSRAANSDTGKER